MGDTVDLNVRLNTIVWNAASENNPGYVGMMLIIQGPEDMNYRLQATMTYMLPSWGPLPTYMVAYQQCYERLKHTLRLWPDQRDQFEHWHQQIISEINNRWTEAGKPLPDLNSNDWSSTAPFFNLNSGAGVVGGQFGLILGEEENPTVTGGLSL